MSDLDVQIALLEVQILELERKFGVAPGRGDSAPSRVRGHIEHAEPAVPAVRLPRDRVIYHGRLQNGE